MGTEPTAHATPRRGLPLILIRGFGGLGVEDEKRIAYQGFNDGTVYPQKRGENYVYEGLILRLLKSDWRYEDATNVVGYYASPVDSKPEPDIPAELVVGGFSASHFSGHKVVIDPAMALQLAKRVESSEPLHTVWVLRYYDLGDRVFRDYADALVRLISFIRELAVLAQRRRNTRAGIEADVRPPRVNIIAHSMGGLIVREAVQAVYEKGEAEKHINRIVTLGTPHQGISFQVLGGWLPGIEAKQELERFDPEFQRNGRHALSYKNFHKAFPLRRLLTVVGTNYRTYGVRPASALNRLFSLGDEFGMNYNRSDGLVKLTSAQIPGAPRTFVHKCHGGPDSLVTSREAFEIATRFFFGDVRVRLRFVSGSIKRGRDFFGRSEFFLGVSVKPRRVDFELFHQSAEAENCYGPFRSLDLEDASPAFGWADGKDLIWEGWLDTSRITPDPSRGVRDLVMRLDFYVGERDLFGVGFSDNVIYRKQYYLQAVLEPELVLYLHTDERFTEKDPARPEPEPLNLVDGGWHFNVTGTGFDGTFRIEVEAEEEEGE